MLWVIGAMPGGTIGQEAIERILAMSGPQCLIIELKLGVGNLMFVRISKGAHIFLRVRQGRQITRARLSMGPP